MSLSLAPLTCSNLNLHSSHSLFAATLRSKPYLSLHYPYPPSKLIRTRFPITRAQSQNGAVVTPEAQPQPQPDSKYGRQYFPLAAVVGQVSYIHHLSSFSLSISLLMLLSLFIFNRRSERLHFHQKCNMGMQDF